MLYTVVSTSLLEELKLVLEARSFLPKIRKEENLLEINIETEEEKEEFELILAFVISYHAFTKIVKKELKQKKLKEEVAENLYNQACQYYQNSKYWLGLTKIWISEFLANQTHIHTDTFATFNMKGFKQETKDYVKYLIESLEYEPPQPKELDMASISINELFAMVKERIRESNLVLSDFKELHLLENGEGFLIQDKNGNTLDDDFFVSHAGIMLKVDVQGEKDETLQNTMMLMCLCQVFEATTIVIHQHLSEHAESTLKDNKESFDHDPNTPIRFVYCSGCEKCDIS